MSGSSVTLRSGMVAHVLGERRNGMAALSDVCRTHGTSASHSSSKDEQRRPASKASLSPSSSLSSCVSMQWVLALLLLLGLPAISVSVVVQVQQGPLRGANSDSGRVVSFLGIPYAEPPVGDLRFMPPVAPQPWSTPTRSFVRPALTFAPSCPQSLPDLSDEKRALMFMTVGRLRHLRDFMPLLRNQSEDCLYLNVFAPSDHLGPKEERRSTPKKAVLVVLHVGDSYEWGSSTLFDSGRVLAAQGNVVVVTLNFRLGILGFLKTGSTANFGLLDQTAALLWVKENIESFGGDPDNITLLGHGHGASLAHLLAASSIASTLFRRLVLMSGNALTPAALASDPDQVAVEVSKQLGCLTDHTATTCLRHKSVDELLSVEVHKRGLFKATFGPVVDGVVVVAHPAKQPSNFALNHHELLTGITNSEALLIFNQALLDRGVGDEGKREMLAALASAALAEAEVTANIESIVNVLDQTYGYEDEKKKANDDDLKNAVDVVRAFGDVKVVRPVLIGAGLKARMSKKPVFVYVFDHDLKEDDFPQQFGSVHGQELAFFLGLPLHPDFRENYSEQDQRVANLALNYLLDFVDKGSGGMSFRRPSQTLPRWPSFESRRQSYLRLSERVSVHSHYRHDAMLLWEKLLSGRPRKHVGNPHIPMDETEQDEQLGDAGPKRREDTTTNEEQLDSVTKEKSINVALETDLDKSKLDALPGSSLAERSDENDWSITNLLSARLIAVIVLLLLLLNICVVALCLTVHRIRSKMRHMPPSRVVGTNNNMESAKFVSNNLLDHVDREVSASAAKRMSRASLGQTNSHVRFGPDTMMMEMASSSSFPSSGSTPPPTSTLPTSTLPTSTLPTSTLPPAGKLRKLSLPSYARSLSSRSSSPPPPMPIIELIPVDEYARLHPSFVMAEAEALDNGSRDACHSLSSFAQPCTLQSPCTLACEPRLFTKHVFNDEESNNQTTAFDFRH